ncbi:orexin [Stegostoma tigrinum]|uniref:orexin n=1 Tax=Stegostoma tigrinum TaxID=3053191 RepID=UPI00202B1681|nr:orexin [Stegostoma tigrinum]
MDAISEKRLCAILTLVLLYSLVFASTNVPKCCRQQTCSCPAISRGAGNYAAGILTLGKRKTNAQLFQSRLYHLLHGLENQATGILTMGKRQEPQILSVEAIPKAAGRCQNITSLLETYFSWALNLNIQTYREIELSNKGLNPRECLSQLLKLCMNSSNALVT